MDKSTRRPFAWSISRLLDYELCPLKTKFRAEKVETKPNKYLERGIAVHKAGEDFLKGKKQAVPADYEQFAPQLRELKKSGAESELELAFTREWEPTGWWDDPWLRVKIDAVKYVIDKTQGVIIVDFKTGRPKPQEDQARLYQVAVMANDSEIDRAQTQFWYLDHGVIEPKKPKVVVRKTFLAGTQKEFELRAGKMERETKFKARPGQHCSFCDYSQRKGGPCKH